MEPVRWVRSPRSGEAARTDGVTVTLTNGSWHLSASALRDGPRKMKTPGLVAYLDRAIEEADSTILPAGWTLTAGVWNAANGWSARPVDGGWGVFRPVKGTVERASQQTFDSSDRARRWAELRFERGEAGLRGPKPRAGSRSASKLPAIRVTEEERAFAEETLSGLGVSYSEFVRAALRFVASGGLRVVRDDDGVRFAWQEATA